MNQLAFDFAVAAFSEYDKDGHLLVQIDAPGLDGKAGTVPAEAVGPGGLVHRPLDPDKDPQGTLTTGAGLLQIMHGDTRHVMPLNDDVRSVKILPPMRKGGTMLYGGAEKTVRSFLAIAGEDPDGAEKSGSILAYASYLKDGATKSHFLGMVVRTPGEESIVFTHGEGQGVVCTGGGKRCATLKNAKGNASVTCDDDGVAIRGKTKVLGALTVGDPGAAQAVVFAQALIAYLAALEVRIASGVGILPPVLPIAAVAPTMASKFTKVT